MTTAIQFAVFGLGTGAVYTLLGIGAVTIYRGSGVLNFSQGAMAMLGAYLYAKLRSVNGWPFAPAAIVSVVSLALLGVLIHFVIMKPLRRSSALSRVIATLGVLLTIETAVIIVWGINVQLVPFFLPSGIVGLGGGVIAGDDRLIMTGIAIALTVVLAVVAKRTVFGLATTGVAENLRGASALGWSPDLIAAINWAIGGALAAVAGIFMAPLSGLQPDLMTLLVIPALAAAIVGGFSSYSLTMVGAFGVGIAQSLIGEYEHRQGAPQSFPLLVIVVFLVIRGRGLPLRSHVGDRFAAVGTGLVRSPVAGGVFAVLSVLTLFVMRTSLNLAVINTFAFGTILLSIVVITGYGGQLSLGQAAIAGFGALITTRLVAGTSIPLELAAPIGIAAAVGLGIVFALPALRTRGVQLAVVTLGLGLVVDAMIFGNYRYSHGDNGILVGPQRLFGIPIDVAHHPNRYAFLTVLVFFASALVVASIRRGRVGRRLISVRANERAAAALGISVRGAKLYAFALGSAIAALGGILVSFQYETVSFSGTWPPIQSILFVAYAVVGGIGFIAGPVLGATLTAGSIGNYIFNNLITGINYNYLALAGGVFLILFLLQDPDGLVMMNIKAMQASHGQSKWAFLRLEVLTLRGWATLRTASWMPAYLKPGPKTPLFLGLRSKTWMPAPLKPKPPLDDLVGGEAIRAHTVAPRVLNASNITVRFGGVVAVSDVSVRVSPGQVVGVIGPNGAGKTTLIDAITGFVRASTGTVALNDRDLTRTSVARRARAGLTRSFQSLELFEDMTVEENLRAAAEPRDAMGYVRDLAFSRRLPLPPAARAAIMEFELQNDLGKMPSQLSYGRRRLLAVARAIAMEPSVLLLDEPASGLGDRETRELATIVRRLADNWGIAILLIEHNMSFVMSVCDRITVLDFGRMIAEGTAAEVRTDPAVRTAYLGAEEATDVSPAPQQA